jgi:hypothetical protein
MYWLLQVAAVAAVTFLAVQARAVLFTMTQGLYLLQATQ